jgi:DNA-binding MarR family transcriptional regulator
MKTDAQHPKVTLPSTSMLPIWRTIYQAMVARLSKWDIPFSVAAATLHLYVHPEDAEPARLAESIFIPRQSMTFTLDALERLKLASRTPHPADRRKKSIVLSSKGKKLGKTMLDDLLAFESKAFEAFPADEQLHLKLLCEKMAEALTALNRDL